MVVMCVRIKFKHHSQKQQIAASIIATPLFLVLLCLFSFQTSWATSLDESQTPLLSSDNETPTAGYFRLSWETNADLVELQEATSTDFSSNTTLYRGPDQARVISGKRDGTWYYRVRNVSHSETGPWSQPVAVTVSHHQVSRAFLFLAVGIIVFIATVIVIIRGSRNTI